MTKPRGASKQPRRPVAAPPAAGDIHGSPGFLIRRLQQIIVSIFWDETRGLDVTPVQYAALMTIRARPGLDQRQLAGAIAFDRSTTGTVVELLDKRGLVRREVNASDRRARQLYLTARGSRLLQTMQPRVTDAQHILLDALAPDERPEFLRLMDKIVTAHNARSRAPLLDEPPPREGFFLDARRGSAGGDAAVDGDHRAGDKTRRRRGKQ